MTQVLAVIPSYLTLPVDLELTLQAVGSLRATEPDVEVLVVDDGSPARELVEELGAACSRLKSRLIAKERNEGFSRTVNLGLAEARDRGMDAVLVNADVQFFESGWVTRMQRQVRSDEDGLADVVGGLLLYASGLIQHAGIFFSLLHRTFSEIYKFAPADLPEARFARVCPVTGALQFIRHSTLERVGVYDENFRLGFEDVDYCLRAFLAGGECVMQPRVRAVHHESMFRGRPSARVVDWQKQSWVYFVEKWRTQSFAQWVPSVI